MGKLGGLAPKCMGKLKDELLKLWHNVDEKHESGNKSNEL